MFLLDGQISRRCRDRCVFAVRRIFELQVNLVVVAHRIGQPQLKGVAFL